MDTFVLDLNMTHQVGVVTGYIPLPVKHLSEDRYRELGGRLSNAVVSAGAIWAVNHDTVLTDCWAYDKCIGLPPSNPPPADRYDTPLVNVMSHIVQHQRTEWAMQARALWPDVVTWVWLDYGILKQGHWNGKPVTEEAVTLFLKRVAAKSPLADVPFPGIADAGTVYPTGNNWRFCGSTHIWPTNWLPDIDFAYKEELCRWLDHHHHVPLDLPVWALVERHNPKIPFRWYPAEYDVSQLANFVGEKHDLAL